MSDIRLYKVAITPKGKYVHGTEYDALCQVLYATEDGGDGCSYISLKPNKNVIPGTDDTVWAISQERGERGPQGESGAGFSDIDIQVDDTVGTPSATHVIENDTLYISFSGLKGADGSARAPIIGDNGNWWAWDEEQGEYVDSGRPSHGIGIDSVVCPTPADGTIIITMTDGNTVTLDLSHDHPSYPKYYLCENQQEYDGIPTKDEYTLYLIPEEE